MNEPKVDYNKNPRAWLLDPGNPRSIYTLVELKARDGRTVPNGSIAYVMGASGGDGEVESIDFKVGGMGFNHPTLTLRVADIESGGVCAWQWHHGNTEIVPTSLLYECRTLCTAAFQAETEDERKELLFFLFRELNRALNDRRPDPSNPVVQYFEQRLSNLLP